MQSLQGGASKQRINTISKLLEDELRKNQTMSQASFDIPDQNSYNPVDDISSDEEDLKAAIIEEAVRNRGKLGNK